MKDVLGQHGVGKLNENGLLTLCSEYQLVITNTLFQLKNKFKTSWQHPCSKHWHLLDYIISLSAKLTGRRCELPEPCVEQTVGLITA